MQYLCLHGEEGEVLQAIGIGICQITVMISSGELKKLVLYDVLYVPEARRNLSSTSKLSQDPCVPFLPPSEPSTHSHIRHPPSSTPKEAHWALSAHRFRPAQPQQGVAAGTGREQEQEQEQQEQEQQQQQE